MSTTQLLATSPNSQALSEVNTFLDAVLCDGRFVSVFRTNPRTVADSLAISISPEVEERITTTPSNELLIELYKEKFSKDEPFRAAIWPALAVGIVIVVGAIIIIIGIVIVVSRREKPNAFITDHSPRLDTKM